MHPVGKAIGWIEKMIGTVFHSLDVFYHHPKFGEAYNAVGAKIWCFCDFIFLSRSEAGTLFVPGGILCAVFLSLFIGRFDAVFRPFFQKDCPFRWVRQFSFLLLGGKIPFKNCEKSKIGRKFVCTTSYR